MKISEAVGNFLADFRAANGFTLDEIATAANSLGAKWTSATISGMEHGGNNVSEIGNFIILTSALSNLAGRLIDSSEIFDAETAYDIANRSKVMGDDLSESLNLFIFNPEISETLGDTQYEELFKRLENPGISSGLVPDDEFRSLRKAWKHSHDLAEKRAARKIGMPVFVFCAWCYYCFGHSMEEENRKLSGEGASPQKRGRINTKILNSIFATVFSFCVDKQKNKVHLDNFTPEIISDFFKTNYPDLK